MIDFHTHILPDIDDGSTCVEESVKMIEMLKEQGVNKIVLTSHFYAYHSSAEVFVENRNKAFKMLCEALEGKNLGVDFYLGGEILFFDELWRIDEIKDFCIKGTNYMLVEPPFASWDNSQLETILKLFSKGIVPVIAHFDRYLKYKGNKQKLKKLVSFGALLQMSCRFVNSPLTRRRAIKYVKNNGVFLLGTDCHNTASRAPDYAKTLYWLKKKLGLKGYAALEKKQNLFLRNAIKTSL